jgi:hypothetical protein
MGSDWIAQATTVLVAAGGIIATTWTARRTLRAQAKLAESNMVFQRKQQQKQDLRKLYADFLNAQLSVQRFSILWEHYSKLTVDHEDTGKYVEAKERLNSLTHQILIVAPLDVMNYATELVNIVEEFTEASGNRDDKVKRMDSARVSLLAAMRKSLE